MSLQDKIAEARATGRIDTSDGASEPAPSSVDSYMESVASVPRFDMSQSSVQPLDEKSHEDFRHMANWVSSAHSRIKSQGNYEGLLGHINRSHGPVVAGLFDRNWSDDKMHYHQNDPDHREFMEKFPALKDSVEKYLSSQKDGEDGEDAQSQDSLGDASSVDMGDAGGADGGGDGGGVGEAVEVNHDSYKFSHGKSPKGQGQWIFSSHKGGVDFDNHKEGEDYFSVNASSYNEAKKQAKAWASEKGHSKIYLGEGFDMSNLDEYGAPKELESINHDGGSEVHVPAGDNYAQRRLDQLGLVTTTGADYSKVAPYGGGAPDDQDPNHVLRSSSPISSGARVENLAGGEGTIVEIADGKSLVAFDSGEIVWCVNESVSCSQCGSVINESWKFCGSCGVGLSENLSGDSHDSSMAMHYHHLHNAQTSKDIKQLHKLSTHDHHEIRQAVASNPHTSERTIRSMKDDSSNHGKVDFGKRNTFTSKSTLHKLAGAPPTSSNIARDPSTSKGTLSDIARNPNTSKGTLSDIARNPNTSKGTLSDIARNPNS